jgi:hypothetical protein
MEDIVMGIGDMEDIIMGIGVPDSNRIEIVNGFLVLTGARATRDKLYIKGSSIHYVIPCLEVEGSKIGCNAGAMLTVLESVADIIAAIDKSYKQARNR